MSNSVLWELLESLSARELRRLADWLASPVFNRREEVVLLFGYLSSCRKRGVSATYPDAIRAVFNHSDRHLLPKLRHEMAALTDLIRKFLVWTEFEDTPGLPELLQLRVMRKRRLEKNFNMALREAETQLRDRDNQSYNRNLDEFRIGIEKYEWDPRAWQGQESPLTNLREKLDAWFAGQALHLSCMEQTRAAGNTRENKTAAAPEALEPLLEQLPSRPHESDPGVALYYLGRRMLAVPQEGERMEKFRLLLEHRINRVSKFEARDLLMLAINHGIRCINAGDRGAIRRTLHFYLLGLERKLLHDDRGILSRYTYNNVLMSFLALEEWDRAIEFLERYREDLEEKERNNIYLYNVAVFRFRKGDFDGTQELLRDVSFADPLYNLESRKMLLKIYFENGAFDALEPLLDNLLVWLRRHGELGYQREMYRNLAMFTKRLLRIPPTDREAFRRLRKKVTDTPLVAERAWLLGKIK